MIKRILLSCLLMLAIGVVVEGQQIRTNVIGVHDMGPYGQAPITGSLTTCQYCHAPHSGLHGVAPLWSQKLSTQSDYTMYQSSTLANSPREPALGSASNLCLSCHDGTVAPGQTTPYGNYKMRGSMSATDVFGTDLSSTHPINFKLPLATNTPNVYPSLINQGTTANSAVKLIKGNVECTSCHEPHVQYIDPVANAFLVVNNSGGTLCLACHEASPTETDPHGLAQANTSSKVLSSVAASKTIVKKNALGEWASSAHASTVYKVSKTANLGHYGDTRRNSCLSCHQTHKAGSGPALLSRPIQALPNVDQVSQNCSSCHNGGSNISPALPNIFTEFEKANGHPLQSGTTGKHAATETGVLDNNRHSTCVDCHDPHMSRPTTSFVTTAIRASQLGTPGVSATDGSTVLPQAANQFEICLRCHGRSAGKQILQAYGYHPVRSAIGGDALNILPQLASNAKSSHPVMHDSNSSYAQPSLRKAILNLDGRSQGRFLTARILCTDCHNSDDNRESGGTGPNGPHGSKYAHVLERRYESSQVAPGAAPVAGPGSTIQNLLPAITDPSAAGPYSLCAKCHDLANVLSDASFKKHSTHINAGFSCSVCHSAHGVAAATTTTSGERLVNFDLAVVGQNDATNAAISYNHSTNTCTLKCHNYNHSANGTVSPSTMARKVTRTTR
jgi:predicted CXXCH cytochrome family protein